MKQILNFIPLVFFFVFLLKYDIFIGVQALMITATLSFFSIWLFYKKLDKMEIISYLMIMVFGGFTLYFREESIIKWKVTIINFLFALILMISQTVFKKNVLQKMLGKELHLDTQSWNRLNLIWVLFFVICGLASIYVTYHESNEFFGIFKAFILPGASLLLSLVSGMFIYTKMDKVNHQ